MVKYLTKTGVFIPAEIEGILSQRHRSLCHPQVSRICPGDPNTFFFSVATSSSNYGLGQLQLHLNAPDAIRTGMCYSSSSSRSRSNPQGRGDMSRAPGHPHRHRPKCLTGQ
uniref:Uncharacterized protein n=1 Tax=Rhizochromulina marina TaxID=1034831 RepID=A0A7S2R544_9STRA|mmetsp:Transcript_11052/g.31715  ORF Transcript_11052/g.31715 Transcript_11052/m.31715 type:complete len:111 (+) Transcript_11052:394-726(+)